MEVTARCGREDRVLDAFDRLDGVGDRRGAVTRDALQRTGVGLSRQQGVESVRAAADRDVEVERVAVPTNAAEGREVAPVDPFEQLPTRNDRHIVRLCGSDDGIRAG